MKQTNRNHFFLAILALSIFFTGTFTSCSFIRLKSAATPNTNFTPAVTETVAPATVPPQTYTAISTLTDLRDYMYGQIAQGNYSFSFDYSGNPSRINEATLKQIVNALYVSLTKDSNSATVFHTTVTPFPGDRIVEAHKSGDTSALTENELRALEKAQRVVKNLQKTAGSEIELELAIHDWLLKTVSLDETSADFSDPNNAPRHVTALGPLLNGSASYQGYVDGFYVLGSIAGLQVDRMSVETEYGGSHMVNTICLDEAWYVVDVTYDDSVTYTDGTQPNYRLFNAGKDQCKEYEWIPAMEHHPIAAESDTHYYYNLPNDGSLHGYPKSFKTMGEATRSIVKEWQNNNRTEHQIMIIGKDIETSDFQNHLINALNATEKAYPATTFYTTTNGKDTFVLVRFH